MAIGLIGTLLPVLPGLLLMWAAGLVYGVSTGFDTVAWVALAALTVLVLGAGGLALRLPAKRTAAAGVSVGSQLLALALAFVGFFVIPVDGAAAGFVAGIYLTRLATTRDRTSAWDSTQAALLAMWQAAAIQFGAGVAIILIWVTWLFAG